MTGDTVRAEVFAKYLDPDPSHWTAALHDLMAAIAGGTAPTGTVIEAVPPVGGDGFPFAGLLDGAKAGDTGPQAYLNILLFDENLTFVDGAFVPVTTTAKENGTNVPHEKLSGEIVVQQPGYAYIYFSNDNDQPLEVFFDDFTVTHSHSAIVQADDYYPFGLSFNSYKRENSVANKYLYNGKEIQEETGWYDYGARMYMPDIGRFGAMDPLTDLMVSWSPYHYTYNNPINFTDPSGMLPADRLGGWSKDFNQGFPEWGRQAIFDDRKPCICGSSNNGDGTNNGGGDDKIYEGKPLGEVTVSAPRRLDGVFGRVADSWMRKGLNYSTYGNIGFGWYETYGLESFPDYIAISFNASASFYDIGGATSLTYVSSHENKNKETHGLFFSAGRQYGFDFSISLNFHWGYYKTQNVSIDNFSGWGSSASAGVEVLTFGRENGAGYEGFSAGFGISPILQLRGGINYSPTYSWTIFKH